MIFKKTKLHKNRLSEKKYLNLKVGDAGFTLVETLVAIAILLIAVVEPLSIVAGSIATANLAKDQVTAYYLAQEGVELVKNKRDSNVLGGGPNWLSGLAECNNSCTIEAADLSVRACPGIDENCALLYKNDGANNTKTFDYAGAPENLTTFRRVISITETNLGPTAGREAEITVEVKWKTGSLYGTGSTNKSFKIKERIFNWSG